MVGVMGMLCGYLVGTLWPNFMSASNPGPAFMMLVAVIFSFVVAYIANRGVSGSTAVNIAINVIQITALVLFAVVALGYRANHPAGTPGWQFDSSSGRCLHLRVLDRQKCSQRPIHGHHRARRRWHAPSPSWTPPASRFPSWSPIRPRTTRATS